MTKIIRLMITILITAFFTMALAIWPCAFDMSIVYLQQGASGDGSSMKTPVGTFMDATQILSSGGTVIVIGEYPILTETVIPEVGGDLFIRGNTDAMLVLSSDLTLEKNTNTNTITFDIPVSVPSGNEATLFGGFNSVTFTENFTVAGTLNFYGGVDSINGTASSASNYEALYNENKQLVTELPYNIIVNGGTFYNFEGGNRRLKYTSTIGAIAAPISITINGGTFGHSVTFGADSAIKNDRAVSISGMSILADDAVLIINGGTFNAPVYAQGYIGEMHSYGTWSSQFVKSDKKYYANDGDITVNINGGVFNGFEIGAAQITAGYNFLLRGNYTVDVGKDAVLADNILFDATQVKSYDEENTKATLTYADSLVLNEKRFDSVNGEAKTYSEPLRIACIGDSITQGTGAGNAGNGFTKAETLSYPGQLMTRLSTEGTEAIVSNYGAGSTMVMDYDGKCYRSTLGYTLSKKETDADYVIIGLGSNDSSLMARCSGQTYHFEEEYEKFVRSYGELPCTDKVFCTSVIYRATYLDCVAASVRPTQKKVLTKLVAEDSDKYTFIDQYALTLEYAFSNVTRGEDGNIYTSDLLGTDQHHPTPSGYAIYVDKLYDGMFNGITEKEGFELTDVYLVPTSVTDSDIGIGTKEKPTSNIGVAMSRLAPEATLHISEKCTFTNQTGTQMGLLTPKEMSLLTIVGDTADAELVLNCKYFIVQSPIVLDNIFFDTSAIGAIFLELCYNNATITENFRNDDMIFVAGYVTVGEKPDEKYYNSRASISSSNDCTINVNGGTYRCFIGGNMLYSNLAKAIYGTYSGNMTINIGSGVTIKDSKYNGANGQNYLTGTVTLNVDAWADGAAIREYSWLGDCTESQNYNESNNTGSVTVNIADDVNASVAVTGDFNGDGIRDIKDFIVMIRYFLNGFDTAKSINFYGKESLSLINLVRALKSLV